MTLNLHWKYAVKIGKKWVSRDEDDKYYLSAYEKNAETRWDMRGALGIKERYLAVKWNVTLGDKPICEIVKVHRPQKIHHSW